MENDVFFIVLLATIMHAIWNAMVKKHPDKTIAVSGIVFGHVPCSIIAIIILPSPTIESIPYIAASVLIHQGYQWFLLTSYKIGDFTKVYPIARGSGPLVATLISIIFLGLALKFLTLLSIFILCIGILILGLFDKAKKNKEIIKYSLLTGLFIGLYSLIDGYGARISLSAISYISWSFVINSLLFWTIIKIKTKKNMFKEVMNKGQQIFWIGGSLSFFIYMIVVWAFTKAPIPMVSALRESSIFFSIFIGYYFLKENFNIKKLISVVFILVGVIGLKLL